MSLLVEHAKRELDILGVVDTPDGDDTNTSMRRHILHMVSEFSKEGHSGGSAEYAINILIQLLKWQPLTELTGADDEWEDRTQMNGGLPFWQNKRCSRVFKDSTGAFDVHGIVFWELQIDENGDEMKNFFTNADSKVTIEFPYMPKQRYVQAISVDSSATTDTVQ